MAPTHESPRDSNPPLVPPTEVSAGSTDPLDPLDGELRPDLELLRPLGEGRSGRVFLARERSLNRLVAVKVLAPKLARDPVARARFEREARAAAALSHPNAVAVHRFGYLTSGVPYLVLQYVKGGKTLEDRLAAEGLLSVPETRRVLAEVADALAAAHRSGFVHRDMRPGNVLCDEESGRVLVSDFGLAGVLPSAAGTDARITRTGEILGAAEYTSPEQLRGEEASEGSDVYALGVMGYRLLTGEGPYEARQGLGAVAAHLEQPPRPLRSLRADADGQLSDLLEHCLAKDPARRPRAAYIAQALRPDPGTAERPATVRAALPGEHTPVLEDLLRRRVPQIVAVTGVIGFAILNFMDQLADRHVIPELIYKWTLATVACSVTASVVIAWFHGRPGRQRVGSLEVSILTLLGLAWLVTCLLLAA